MKPKPHFLPKRQTVIYGFTEQMLRDTGTNRRSFAMVVADQYLSMYAQDDREVPFRITLGGEGDGDADEVDAVELGDEGGAEGLDREAGAVGNEEDAAAVGHGGFRVGGLPRAGGIFGVVGPLSLMQRSIGRKPPI